MKRLFQPLATAMLGLALFSCDKSEPMNRTNGGDLLGEPTRFEMSSSLGAVGIESLSSNTDKADEELRANLHFRGLNSIAQTTLDAAKFGEGKPLQAHWAVKYAAGYYSEPCPVSKGADLDEAEKVQMKKSTVCFIGTNNNTIGGASVKMYTTTSKELKNITSSIMILDGSVTNNEDNKVYFADGKSDPNHLIKGLKTTSEFQADRHIPIMTKLEPFAKMQVGGQDNDQVKFAPRGSLIGLNIKNTTGEQMIVTKIIVPKDGALYHRGHFEWASDAMPTFVGNNGSAAELAFPAEGTVANDAQACFYVWGFQDANKKGEAFKVQIAYKTTASGSEERTRTFSVYAPKSKVTLSEKMFDDGYAYNVVLTVNATNKLGGTAADWNDGGILETVLNPLALVAEFDIAKVADTQGTNHTLAFVPNHNISSETDYTNYQVGTDVGLYTWAEAMRLFGYDVEDDNISTTGWAQLNTDWQAGKFDTRKYQTISGEKYYIPNEKELNTIIPYNISEEESKALQNQGTKTRLQLIVFDNSWAAVSSNPVRRIGKLAGKAGLRDVQIGKDVLLASEYDDEYITKEVPLSSGHFVTYAKRFIGTQYESAWRYEYKQADTNGGNRVIIKNVMLGQNTNKSLANDIANETFFNGNNIVERVFPSYGFIKTRYNGGILSTTLEGKDQLCATWSSTLSTVEQPERNSTIWNVLNSKLFGGYGYRYRAFCVRPFKKP